MAIRQAVNELVSLCDRGRFEEALKRGEALAGQYPENPLILNVLGAANFSLGRLEQALTSFSGALQAAPDFAEAHNNMGNALNALARPAEALTSFDRALQIKPGFVEAHFNKANALYALGRFEEAVTGYRRTLEIRPDIADAHNNLGNALCSLGRHEEAVDSYRSALRFRPEFSAAHGNLGRALHDLGRPEEALDSYRRALEIRPDDAIALNDIGNVLKELDKSEEAMESFRRAMQVRPDYAEAHLNLSAVRNYRDRDPHVRDMLQLAERQDLPENDRMMLCFALGKAFGDIGDYEKAFSFLREGNRLRKKELNYDIAADRALFDNIQSSFPNTAHVRDVVHDPEVNDPEVNDPEVNDPEVTDPGVNDPGVNDPGVNDPGDSAVKRPVFILGMPRSGTSLVEQILASHSRVYGGGEMGLLEQSVDAVGLGPMQPGSGQMGRIRELYLTGLAKIDAPEPFVTDKAPLNFRLVGYALAAMPEAKIIHLQRDARATCWSNFKRLYTEGNGFTYDLLDLAEYYKLYIQFMEFWHQMFPGQIYDLCYESLTENQEGETRKLLDHVGLDWEDQCLEFHETRRSVKTASKLQVRQKMYQGSSEEWRKYRKHLGPMVDSLKGL